jgi:exodeoxyribonuclease III
MRIVTWNVNSLPARKERVLPWLEHSKPDVLLMQETKIADSAMPHAAFEALGYKVAHHGQGRWNGVAIASRVGIEDVVTNFGEPLSAPPAEGEENDQAPLSEARMISARCGGVQTICIYAPNGRTLDSVFWRAKLAWFARLETFLKERCDPSAPLVLAGDFNVAPEDRDVWNVAACNGGTHVSPEERAAVQALSAWGLTDAYRAKHEESERYSWWDYRAGMFHKNYGMRIDLMLVTASLGTRVVACDIDREARKGKPTPSDHAPVFIDIDEPGHPIDTGWKSADGRIAARRK